MSEPAPVVAASLVLPILCIILVTLFLHAVLALRRRNTDRYTQPAPEDSDDGGRSYLDLT